MKTSIGFFSIVFVYLITTLEVEHSTITDVLVVFSKLLQGMTGLIWTEL